jgi:hypothetical protein
VVFGVRTLAQEGKRAGVPDWLERHPRAHRGISPAIRGFDDFDDSIFYAYSNPPAEITAEFASGCSVTVFVGSGGDVHAVARDETGAAVASAAAARQLALTAIQIQPQVAPLGRDEPPLERRTVRQGEGTYLAPLHFRNQLALYDGHFSSFKQLVEQTWPGLEIRELTTVFRDGRPYLALDVRDGGFVGEVSLMGDGLQMWLQMVWFLARAAAGGVVVLDEPDVYLHPDLQQKLLGLVREGFEQLLVATHSIEFISDVDPHAILTIDRMSTESRFVSSLPGAQAVIDALGGVQNLQLARLMRSERLLIVEGEDAKILAILRATACPADPSLDLLPPLDLGGRGGWGHRLSNRVATEERIWKADTVVRVA